MRLLNFFKKEKRNTWIPWSSAISSKKGKYLSGNLPSVARCLQLYKNLALITPLIAIDRKTGEEVKDHNLLRVLEAPAKYLTYSQWLSRLVESLWLEGNYYCYISTKPDGFVDGLLPFVPGSCYAYSQGKGQQADHSDPIELNRNGSYYYLSQFEKKGENGQTSKVTARYTPEQILHFKRQWQSQGDLLNGPSLYEAYTETINLASSCLETADRFAENGMTPPLLISGLEGADNDARDQLKEAIEDFFESQANALTLPEGAKVEQVLPGSNPGHFLSVLSSIGSLNVCRLFAVPPELAGVESFQTQHAGPAIKEIFRFFVRTSGRAFLKELSETLSTLSSEIKFKFLVKSVLGSDLREIGTTIKSLRESGVSEDDALEYLRDE